MDFIKKISWLSFAFGYLFHALILPFLMGLVGHGRKTATAAATQ